MVNLSISGDPTFLRFAVAEHPEGSGKFGIILVDDRNGVSPVGRGDFDSRERAVARFRDALAEVIGKTK